MFRPFMAALLLFPTLAFAADPPADPYASKIVVLKRDSIPLVAGQTPLGDTGPLAQIYASRSDGDRVLVRYKAQDVWLKKADVLLPADAVVYFTALLDADPKAVPALIRRGAARILTNQIDKALEDFNAAVTLDPKSAAALSYRATALRFKNEPDKAMADYDAAEKLAPTWWAVPTNRGVLRNERKDYDGAIRDYDAAIKLDAGWGIPFHNRARAWIAKNEPFRALADFGEALRLDPAYAPSLLARAELYTKQGQRELAMKDLDTVVEQFPATASFRLARARALHGARDYAKAAADLEVAVKTDPQNAEAMHHLALLLSAIPIDELRDGKRALALATRALELSKFESYHEGIAAAHAELGQYDKAIEAQKRFVQHLETLKHSGLELARHNLAAFESKRPLRLAK